MRLGIVIGGRADGGSLPIQLILGAVSRALAIVNGWTASAVLLTMRAGHGIHLVHRLLHVSGQLGFQLPFADRAGGAVIEEEITPELMQHVFATPSRQSKRCTYCTLRSRA